MKKLLSETHPELKKEWHPTANENFRFEDAFTRSHRVVWWICKKNPNHTWQAKIANRSTKGYGCLYCAGRLVSPERSLATLYPEVAAEWHPVKNGSLSPDKVAPFSNKKAWWKCTSGHEWHSSIQHRTKEQTKCKQCRIAERSLINTHPDLASEWHPTKNLPLTANDVTHGMSKTVWWKCREGHVWRAKVSSRADDKTGCLKCNMASRKNKIRYVPISEALPELAKQWHPTKNLPLMPDQVLPGSNKMIWWICLRNGAHVWQASVNNRRKGRACPYCSKRPSFAERFPDLAKEWHPTKNGDLKPTDVLSGSARRVWWRCLKDATYEWQSTVTNRTHSKGRQKICPHCSGYAVTEKTNLAINHPLIAKEWHPTKNLELTPSEVTRASAKKVWWKCCINPEHEWLAQIKNRTILGTGCPICASENSIKRVYEAAQANYDFLKTFTKEISNIRRLLKHRLLNDLYVKQPVLRMIYAAAITAMETYLCDAFFHKVTANDALIEKFLKSVPEFKERKYAVTDILDWKNQIQKKVTDYLLDIVWHNLARVQILYENVLEIKFPDNIERIHRGIAIRHDIVHRNGRTKSGKFHGLKVSAIELLLDSLEAFIADIDTQLKFIARQSAIPEAEKQ